ncbi:sushi, von Willebrand factor type a, egf and pentraxin domain-containing protein 1 [Plakobranchus ocellatus]|uniref:Sushi, von Willebrand factor type a, egf and pentraxin domain-containing protein 1 n=1 Tax=Plakobranchus ocellatus TaxID=259542 RepID=A0AAV3Z914_9GAST|nr:sushi, von Willebrand factor type a, egf and pentraxin domain-containing protein 1 [Plakobranchus ocellatus]
MEDTKALVLNKNFAVLLVSDLYNTPTTLRSPTPEVVRAERRISNHERNFSRIVYSAGFLAITLPTQKVFPQRTLGALVAQWLAMFRCPKLSPPIHGYFVNKKCNNVFNAACGLKCEHGYELRGSSLRICQDDGTWSGSDATCITSPQQSDLRLLGAPSGQGAGSGVRTRDRMVPADLRADSLPTVPPTPPAQHEKP